MSSVRPRLTRQQLEAEVDRLRRRTHEIQERADRELARHRRNEAQRTMRVREARERVADFKADWTTDPMSQQKYGWWRYTSQVTIDIVTELVAEAGRYRAALERIADGNVPGVSFAEPDLISEFASEALQEEEVQ